MAPTPSQRDLWKRFGATAGAAAIVLGVMIGASSAIRAWVLTDWDDYAAMAALFIGVGGVFAFVAMGSDAARESANVVGLGAVGFGGVMLALKEVTSPFSAFEQTSSGSNQGRIGFWLFMGVVALVFAVLVVLLALSERLSSNGEQALIGWTFALVLVGLVLLIVSMSSNIRPRRF